MISVLKERKEVNRTKHFMEWECHGLVWQLQLTKRWRPREIWAPQCPVCGEFGQSYLELKSLEQVDPIEKGGEQDVRDHNYSEKG